ncbi:MAG: M23 family metallopeptidase, partial [Clostridia bacterium]
PLMSSSNKYSFFSIYKSNCKSNVEVKKLKELRVYDCEVSEEEWLDVNFIQKNYLQEEQAQIEQSSINKQSSDKKNWRGIFSRLRKVKAPQVDIEVSGLKKHYKKVIAGCIAIAMLVCMRFVDSGFVGEIFSNAKTVFTSNIVANYKAKETIKLPIATTVEGIENGEVAIVGAKIVYNMCAGTVEKIIENCVEVKIDDNTTLIYSQLGEVLVAVGQQVKQYDILGKYTDNTTFCVVYKGEKVTNVVNTGKDIVWQI